MTNIEIAAAHGYEFRGLAEFFDEASDTQTARANAILADLPEFEHGAFVLFDAEDEFGEWMLIGPDPEALAAETVAALGLTAA
jgi:hypothetical protein